MDQRAPIQPNHKYTQLRVPHNLNEAAASAAIASNLPATSLLQSDALNYDDCAQNFLGEYAAAATAVATHPQLAGHQLPINPLHFDSLSETVAMGGAISPTKFSKEAKVFVPNNPDARNNLQYQAATNSAQIRQDRGLQNYGAQQLQQQSQQRFYTQNQRQYGNVESHANSYYNGYHQGQEDLNNLHHQQHQQQQYTHNNTGYNISSLQDRLRINGAANKVNNATGAGNSGNYFQQQQTQQPYVKHFHRYPHLNHYQQHAHHQQQQQQHHHNLHYQQQQQHHHHHHQQHHHHHQQQQQQQQQQLQQQQQQQYYDSTGSSKTSGNDNSTSSHPDMETIALEYLDTVIHCLNQNPGQFDSIAERFLTIFEGMENNNYVLSIAMEDIFEKSIEHPNFRYMGAKLYNLLHMMNAKSDSLFMALLKCKLDYHKTEVEQFIEKGQYHKVRETALFLAELYMQLRGEDTRIHLIAENIVFSLKQLLAKETNDNVRCICFTLKLAGYDLTTDCPDDMKDIIAKLETIVLSNPGKHPLAANVISLQKDNWGRRVSNSLGDVESSKPPEPPRMTDDPVFYGPDGRELTAEESEFLDDGAGPSDEEDIDNDLVCGLDPEMDEETERDYKEFCKTNIMQQVKTNSNNTPSS